MIGSAFPVVETTETDRVDRGMTIRDWFAGQALLGMIHELSREEAEHPVDWDEYNAGLVAAAAYRFADAMLAERSKGGRV